MTEKEVEALVKLKYPFIGPETETNSCKGKERKAFIAGYKASEKAKEEAKPANIIDFIYNLISAYNECFRDGKNPYRHLPSDSDMEFIIDYLEDHPIISEEAKKEDAVDDWPEKLFKHMDKQHNLILLNSELHDIKEIILPTKYPYTL